MKRSLLLLSCCMGYAQAHEVWVDAGHAHGGAFIRASLGYGHFPVLEDIPEERLPIFQKPLQLVTPEGTVDMVRSEARNIYFTSADKMPEGSYLITAEYAPTFWSKNEAGWRQESMKEMSDAQYCELTQMFGKMVINVGIIRQSARL